MPRNMGQNFGEAPQYWDEYAEEEPELDEDGQPLQSPEEIKNIINSIPSFKFEENKEEDTVDKSSTAKSQIKGGEKVSCAICLDNLQAGQMVKALPCSHKFHSKCINFWLKQKLKCPLCKMRINLA